MWTWVAVLNNLGWGFSAWEVLLLAAELLALATLPSVLLSRRGEPQAALSWTLTLIAVPFLGVISWWLIGRSHLRRKRGKRWRARWEIRKGFAYHRPETLPAPGAQVLFSVIQRLPEAESAGYYQPVAGNRVTVLTDGQETYAALEQAILGAEHHLHLLFYTFEPDATGRRFRDLLIQKVRAGVRVRLLLDAMGSAWTRSAFLRPLQEAGGEVAFFAPVRFFRRSLSFNFRNHRKILVADSKVAYTGGLNIGDRYTHDWRDGGLLLRGPVACQFQEVFLDDWYFATGKNLANKEHLRWSEIPILPEGGNTGAGAVCTIVAGGPDAPHNATHDAFFLALTTAKERIWITTPYFIPDLAIQSALRTAVYRGLDVRLLVPQHSDLPWTRLAGRSFFSSLLRSGVRIFEYQPGILHGKTWIFDHGACAAGSANLDTRSFKLNFEVSCFVHDEETNRRMAELFEADLKKSKEVTLASVEQTSATQRLVESALHLMAPLL